MAKLISILSTGHSGSTLLNLLIGTLPGVFPTGELKYLPWQISRSKNELGSFKKENLCSCSKKFQQCVVWHKVIDSLSKQKNIDIINNPFDFKISILNSGVFRKKLNFSEKLLNKTISLAIKKKYNKIIDYLKPFYINEEKNKWDLINIILRSYLLYKYRPNDTFLIINNRKNLGYVTSQLLLDQSIEKSLKNKYKYFSKVDDILNNSKVNYLKLNYENWVKEPELYRKKIAKFLGIEIHDNKISIDTRKNHLVAGNPIKYKGKIEIRYDEKYKYILKQVIVDKINSIAKKYQM